LPDRAIESRFGPVVKGFDQSGSGTPRERETVANDPDRAGVNRDNNRAAWAGRTMHTRRKNRKDDVCSRKSDSGGIWNAAGATLKRDGPKAGCLG